jgi:hypothetical protein
MIQVDLVRTNPSDPDNSCRRLHGFLNGGRGTVEVEVGEWVPCDPRSPRRIHQSAAPPIDFISLRHHPEQNTSASNMPTLEDLPLEIVLEILAHTKESHNEHPTPKHPLNEIASTNKHFYAIVEEYMRGLLKLQANFTPPKSSKTFSCRKKWLKEYCQFCARKCQRRATFYQSLRCCVKCDRTQFPKLVGLPSYQIIRGKSNKAESDAITSRP